MKEKQIRKNLLKISKKRISRGDSMYYPFESDLFSQGSPELIVEYLKISTVHEKAILEDYVFPKDGYEKVIDICAKIHYEFCSRSNREEVKAAFIKKLKPRQQDIYCNCATMDSVELASLEPNLSELKVKDIKFLKNLFPSLGIRLLEHLPSWSDMRDGYLSSSGGC